MTGPPDGARGAAGADAGAAADSAAGAAAGAAADADAGAAAAANEAVWRSGAVVRRWVESADRREAKVARPLRLMADLLPFAVDEPFTFLDLGAGTGPASRAILERYPSSVAVLADFSREMMAEGSRAMEPWVGRYRYVELDLLHGPWPGELPGGGFAAVVSSLCIHHVPDDRKRTLFAEILERLAPGGWYLNYDPVNAVDPVVEAAWERVNDRRDPEAAGRRGNRTPEEQAQYDNHIRHMAPLDRQLGYLRAAGFDGVDVYWKHLEYVVFGGRRPG